MADVSASERMRRFAVREMRAALEPVLGTFGDSLARSTRIRKDWARAVGAADEVQGEDRERIVGFSRSIVSTTPLGKAFTEATVRAVVGDGIFPQGTGPAEEAAAMFWRWAHDTLGADLLRERPFGEMQRTMLREMVVGGDIIEQHVEAPDGHPMGIAMELIEGDRLGSGYGLGSGVSDRVPDGHVVVDGVEKDRYGRHIRYHVASWTSVGMGVSSRGWRTVALDSHIIGGPARMLAYKERLGQTRGLPYLCAALGRLADIEQYDQAVNVAATLAACVALVTKSDSPAAMEAALRTGTTDASGPGGSVSGGGDDEGDGTASARPLAGLGPGQMFHVPVNNDIKTVSASQPGSGYDQFQQVNARKVAAAAGMPVEVAMGDFSRANFSVARMALLIAETTAQPLRELLVRVVLQPFYEFWLATALAQGTLPDSVASAGFDALARVRWIAPQRLVVDPTKELDAEIKAIAANLDTQEAALDRRGLRIGEVYAARKAEKDKEIELGIVPPPPAGAAAAPPDDAGDAGDQRRTAAETGEQ